MKTLDTTLAAPASAREEQSREEIMNLVHELHGKALLRYLMKVTLGDRREAEDLVQETMLRAWVYFEHRVADAATLRPWLFTVARRLAIDAARARRARPTEVIFENLGLLPETHDGERVIESVAIRRQLATLSPQQRRVLIEIFYLGRSAQEAAKAIGIPEGTVKSRMHYALRALRAQMSEEAGDRRSGAPRRHR